MRAVGKDFRMRLRGWKGIDKESKVVKERKDAQELKVNNKVEWVFFASNTYQNKEFEEETAALLKDNKENLVMCNRVIKWSEILASL